MKDQRTHNSLVFRISEAAAQLVEDLPRIHKVLRPTPQDNLNQMW